VTTPDASVDMHRASTVVGTARSRAYVKGIISCAPAATVNLCSEADTSTPFRNSAQRRNVGDAAERAEKARLAFSTYFPAGTDESDITVTKDVGMSIAPKLVWLSKKASLGPGGPEGPDGPEGPCGPEGPLRSQRPGRWRGKRPGVRPAPGLLFPTISTQSGTHLRRCQPT
jgi:hypothetical protein